MMREAAGPDLPEFFMRVPVLLALATLAATAQPAAADPAQDARSAVGACLAAVIDKAPVVSVKDGAIEIVREAQPNSCTVRVQGGQPVVVREAVLQALAKRGERFTPAKTAWDPDGFASRETYCSLPSRRPINVVVSTAKPGEPLTLIATVFDAAKRDTRCDRDEGLQKPAISP
jgi:hypothetical protein